ncbi:hypothetical protein J3R73_004863 [Labrys monachus]|uniref:Uncharacterized protein n=2 Tax=Labrys monachus TaxID=217067 RepID=A0ABU0FKQ0_9HYPH|nr:hypothetical protein [Labrys monachus]
MLVVQKFGLKWLAKPVAVFVRTNPTVECRYYPGDLTFAALTAHAELLQHAPEETKAWLKGDFDWVPKTYGFTRHFTEEALALLAEARRLARLRQYRLPSRRRLKDAR